MVVYRIAAIPQNKPLSNCYPPRYTSPTKSQQPRCLLDTFIVCFSTTTIFDKGALADGI